jgi:hypothetical protein
LARLSPRRLSPVWLGSVSSSRSSNRTGGFPASGSRKRRTPNRTRHVTPSATSEHNLGVSRLIVNPHVLCCFLRWSLTEAPSLHRSYPASSVLRASPPPQTARPVSRELPVDRTAITAGVSRVTSGLLCLHAVAITPAGWMETDSLVLLPSPRRPSPISRWVGSCINRFGACSAFTHVTACMLAESPSDPFHRKLRQLRFLRCRFDCYRVERTSSRAGLAPAEVQRLFTAHVIWRFINSSVPPRLFTHRSY